MWRYNMFINRIVDIIIVIIINYVYILVSSQVATQLWNGAANALNRLRDVEQLSFQFVSEYSLWNVWSLLLHCMDSLNWNM